MAHQINFNPKTSKHSFMSVKEKAWHGLGQIVDRCLNSSEAIEYAGLDYIVEKRPIFTYDTENHLDITGKPAIPQIEVPQFLATVRTDTEQVLGVVGPDYEVVQNRYAFSFFDTIVRGGNGILYETAGALGNGERVFITAKLPDHIRVGMNDWIGQYLLLSTSHNGSGSITAAFTPVRVVCNNTLNAALRNSSAVVKIRHTASATERLKQAHTLLGIVRGQGTKLEGLFNQWAKARITDSEVKKLIQIAMAPGKETLDTLQSGESDLLSAHYKNTVDQVYAYALTHETQQLESTAGTVFGAYNAITGYFQNAKPYKSEEAKFKSIMDGTAKRRAQTAFDLCRDFACHGAAVLNFN